MPDSDLKVIRSKLYNEKNQNLLFDCKLDLTNFRASTRTRFCVSGIVLRRGRKNSRPVLKFLGQELSPELL